MEKNNKKNIELDIMNNTGSVHRDSMFRVSTQEVRKGSIAVCLAVWLKQGVPQCASWKCPTHLGLM